MTFVDHLWEFLFDLYYIAKDFQTLFAGIIVLLGGRYVYRTEMKIHRDKQKERAKAIGLHLQTKIQESLVHLSAIISVTQDNYKEFEKQKPKDGNLLVYMKPAAETYFSNDHFYKDRSILTDLFYLEIEKSPIFSFFSTFENLRRTLTNPHYTWNLSQGKRVEDLNKAELESIIIGNYKSFKLFLSLLKSPFDFGIKAVESLAVETKFPANTIIFKKELENFKKFIEKVKKEIPKPKTSLAEKN